MAERNHKPLLILALLILVSFAVNLTKPVHIDDPVYLEMAAGILEQPLHPMSTRVNWYGKADPVHRLNQPPLFPYLLAVVIALFGESELAAHALVCVFSGVAIIFFFRICQVFIPKHALILSALLALGPTFLIAQNVMVDVPVLAVWNIAFWGLLTSTDQNLRRRHLISAVAIGVACLIKYTSLVLLPIYVVACLQKRTRSTLKYIAIPLAILLGWSLFNIYDYGGVHLLGREMGGNKDATMLVRLMEWLVGLGALTPVMVAFLHKSRGRLGLALLIASGVAGAILLVSQPAHPAGTLGNRLLWSIFFANGIYATAWMIRGAIVAWDSSLIEDAVERHRSVLILALWFLATFAFSILFAPFTAARHILLLMPPCLILLGHVPLRGTGPRWGYVGLTATCSLGLLLAVSDYSYANASRKIVSSLTTRVLAGHQVFYAGRWGWHWYAREAGMEQLDYEASRPTAGDYVLVPLTFRYELNSLRRSEELLERVYEVEVPAAPWAWVRTMSSKPWGGYYSFKHKWRSVPWHFSTDPIETFLILRFKNP